jgi:transposase
MFAAHKTATDMGKIKRMDQIRRILETYIATNSLKATSRRLQVSRNTVKVYVRLAQTFNEDLSGLLLLPESELLSLFYPSNAKLSIDREEVFKSQLNYWIKELRRVGVSRHLLWQEYRQKHPQGYGYSQFCERLGREVGRRDLTIGLNHQAGKVMQVDFAGKKMRWVDVYSGEVHECEVLVAVFPHSQYTFAIALASQKVADFMHGLNQALLFFAGLPQVILSDNLKSYVIKADKYDPTFNDLCVQLAAHYQIDLSATRVGKPKDKASVENMVGTVYRRIYAPLRNELFHSLEELNTAISQQLSLHNSTPYQQKPGTRHEIFHTYELPLMRQLPSDLFEVKKIITAQVRRNYHVYLSEERNYYSVPYQHAGKQATAIYTSTIVQVYIDNQRVATHERLLHRDAYQHQTNPEHMPKSHSEWKKARGFNAAYFLAEAEKIGVATRWAVEHILVSRIHETQSYDSCQGLLRLAGKYSNVRLEKAAARCQKVGKASYSMIKRILSHKLDMESDQLELFNMPEHDNIRGPEAYQ